MMAAQIIAVVIFVFMFVMLVLEIIERHTVTLLCGAMTLVVVFIICMGDLEAAWNVINLESFAKLGFWYTTGHTEASAGINWETICFIAGMMVMVEGMAESGFFRWLCMLIAKAVKYRPAPIFMIFMVLSAVLSMFIDSITVIMFLAAVTAELARLIRTNPVPMILAEVFCANLGGSATMCGDPPNIIIGTSLGYTFADFISNTGLIALVSIVVILPYFYIVMGRKIKAGAVVDASSAPSPSSAITSKRGFALSCIIFLLAVVLLITHAATGLTVSTIGIFIALLTLVCSGKKALHLLKKVDYKTILFFVGLFVAVSGLECTGVLEILAGFIEKLSGGNSIVIIAIIIWGGAIASAFVDNIPFAATMIPVIKTLAATQGMELSTLAWALSMGTDIGGSATPIGASANVVGTAIAAKNGYPIGWGQYCKVQAPATVIVIAISTIYMIIFYL
ncbi:MAG: citrate transporter [Ruminococcaceae bacterium]|nr:citrate transporter [Oscillospiraceae bacterium]